MTWPLAEGRRGRGGGYDIKFVLTRKSSSFYESVHSQETTTQRRERDEPRGVRHEHPQQEVHGYQQHCGIDCPLVDTGSDIITTISHVTSDATIASHPKCNRVLFYFPTPVTRYVPSWLGTWPGLKTLFGSRGAVNDGWGKKMKAKMGGAKKLQPPLVSTVAQQAEHYTLNNNKCC